MNKEIKEKWVAALKSGDYEQGKYALRKNNKYCCLGVLCDIYSKEIGVEWEGQWIEGENKTLPIEISTWCDIEPINIEVDYDTLKQYLTELNDTVKLPFREIADVIENQL